MTKAKQPVQARKDAAGKKIRVTLMGGLRGTLHNHRESVKGLGLKRIRQTVEVEDTPSIRGMINQVSYLVKVED
jgi:large subunit ribosomal protein L30